MKAGRWDGHVFERRDEDVAQANDLKRKTCKERERMEPEGTDVLVLDVLEKLELAISALAEDGGGEGFHDLLDSDRRACELVFGGAWRDARVRDGKGRKWGWRLTRRDRRRLK